MIEVKQLGKVYPGKVSEQPLTDLNFRVEEGEMVAVMGPSGSGKSTLINLLATLDEPSWGSILIDGIDTATFKRKETIRFRRETLGIIFQEFNLLDSLTLGENMLVPLMLTGKKAKPAREEMEQLARRLQIDELLDKQVDEVSGGQRQRTAIGRALIHAPRLMLADEPTGALDFQATKHVMDVLAELNAAGMTMVIVTHDPQVASYCNHVLFLKDGSIQTELFRDEPRRVFFQRVIESLSLLGGDEHQLSAIRPT